MEIFTVSTLSVSRYRLASYLSIVIVVSLGLSVLTLIKRGY